MTPRRTPLPDRAVRVELRDALLVVAQRLAQDFRRVLPQQRRRREALLAASRRDDRKAE